MVCVLGVRSPNVMVSFETTLLAGPILFRPVPLMHPMSLAMALVSCTTKLSLSLFRIVPCKPSTIVLCFVVVASRLNNAGAFFTSGSDRGNDCDRHSRTFAQGGTIPYHLGCSRSHAPSPPWSWGMIEELRCCRCCCLDSCRLWRLYCCCCCRCHRR